MDSNMPDSEAGCVMLPAFFCIKKIEKFSKKAEKGIDM
jgi:hypothetical protein